MVTRQGTQRRNAEITLKDGEEATRSAAGVEYNVENG